MTGRAGLWAALLVALSACQGQSGTVHIALVAAPGSGLLDQIQRARATLSDPHVVSEADRQSDGSLALDLDVEARNQGASVMIEGFDAGDQRIAIGFTPPIPISAIDANITVYLGPPLAMAEAPVALDPPRSEMGGALLPYGAIFMGGRGADGAPLADVTVYDVYDHSLTTGADLPAARAAPTVVVGRSNYAYAFGGQDSSGQARSEAWRFDLTVAPAGEFKPLQSDAGLARAGASGVYLGSEAFLVAGDPAVLLDGVAGDATAYAGAPTLTDGVGVLLANNVTPLIFVAGRGVAQSGALVWTSGSFRSLDAPSEIARSGHGVVTLPGGRALVVGGTDDTGTPLGSAVLYDGVTDQFAVLNDFLATARTGAAVAATPDYVIVAGGVDASGAVLPDAELFDAQTLDPVDDIDLVVPRTGALALPLANRQVLVAGGTDAGGAPVGSLELFTPDR